MSDCRFGVSPVNYPDPDPELRSVLFPKHSRLVQYNCPIQYMNTLEQVKYTIQIFGLMQFY